MYNLGFYCLGNSGFLFGETDLLNQNMKRASVNFDQTHSADDEAKEKFEYQTLLKEYLELQKEYVSRKRKLQAAKQNRELTLAEVRFLRRKHKYLLKSQAPNETKKPSTLQDGRNPSTIDQPCSQRNMMRRKKEGVVYMKRM